MLNIGICDACLMGLTSSLEGTSIWVYPGSRSKKKTRYGERDVEVDYDRCQTRVGVRLLRVKNTGWLYSGRKDGV